MTHMLWLSGTNLTLMRTMSNAILATFAANSEESEEAIEQAYTEVWGPNWADMFRYEAFARNDKETCAIMVKTFFQSN